MSKFGDALQPLPIPQTNKDTLEAGLNQVGTPGTPGAAAGFGTPTVTINMLAAGQPATASVVASGPNTAKVFAFTFNIPASA